MIRRLFHIMREENFRSLAGNLVVAAFGIASFSWQIRHLSADTMGQWVLFVSAASLLDMLRFGATSNALVRFLSGAPEDREKELTGSSITLNLGVTLVVIFLLWMARALFPQAIDRSAYRLFFHYYPYLALATVSWNQALSVLQAKRMYGRIFLLKFMNSGLFFVFTLAHGSFFGDSPDALAWGYIAVNLLLSLVSTVKGWDGLVHVGRTTRGSLTQLAHFGKYSLFTMVGTSLLRSADTLIISLSPLGAPAVALYSIPLKLTEIQQIPLRSFAATAFPKMSRASLEGDLHGLRRLFYDYSGALSLLFVFSGVLCVAFAEPIIHVMAGRNYDSSVVAGQASPVAILQVLAVYGLLLPLDRMTGIALDSIGKPAVNAMKVFLMLATNILGDVLAIFVFKSLLWVAVASVVFTVVGIWVGYYFLDRELSLDAGMIYTHGRRFYADLVHRVRQLAGWRAMKTLS